MDAQVESAIDIALSPTANQQVKSEAYEFLERVRTDASSWHVCLGLFTRLPALPEVVRHFGLDAVNGFVQSSSLDEPTLGLLKDNLFAYVQQRYAPGQRDVDPTSLQNKATQTLTYLFTSLYGSTWTTFIDDFLALAGDSSSLGSVNPAATLLYLRILRSIHDEIADVLIPRTAAEMKRNNDLKDLVRERDARKIAASWQEILSRWRQIDLSMVELCLQCISRWVSWTDISLIVNENMLRCLWDLAGQQGITSPDSKESRVRDGAIETFTETVGKKMPPSDKIELIRFLNLQDVIGRLIETPGLSELRSTSSYDTDMAEAVAKLTDNVILDLVKVLDNDEKSGATRSEAESLLQACMPYLLRFLADEYDEICSSVIPSLTELLTMFRKKIKSGNVLPPQYQGMLQPILDSIIAKMKYDDTAEWGDEDEQTDEAEFQGLRKRLHVLQQTVAAVDEDLYMKTVSRLVNETFINMGSSNNTSMTWRDLDLAMHEMFLFGELVVKYGGLYQRAAPFTPASQSLIEMMTNLVNSSIASYPHPSIQLQYMEICVRYCTFFEHNTNQIPAALENFVRVIHASHVKVRTRSWYLFFRFVKHLRGHLGDVAQNVIQAVGDLLIIKAELPGEDADEDISSEDNDQSEDAVFTAQLYLFEAVGSIASISSIPIDRRTFYAQSLLSPLVTDLNNHLSQAINGDEKAVLQVHHLIMAIGTLAKGFCDWMPGVTSGGSPPPPEISREFMPASEANLTALESLKHSIQIRTAARFTFSRMLGVQGSRILEQLPRWIDGLLSQASTNDEMATFLRLLDQVVFGFKTEIFSILDQLLSPLLQRVYASLSEPVDGTDDEIQLAELKLQYLNFILVILNNDLSGVFVSATNQSSFEGLFGTIEHFCRDSRDFPNGRLALGVLTRMTIVWGGPDIPISATGSTQQQPSPVLPGFDTFIIQRFSPLSWALPSSPSFNPKDAQARSVLIEAATLQWTVLRKTGGAYETWLRDTEMRNLGFPEDMIGEYLARLRGDDIREFRKFFAGFVAKARG